MVFSNNLLMGAGGQASGYEIEQSIRFNNDDSPTMSRSFGTPTDQNKFTYAFWMKSTSQANGCNLSVNVSGGVTWASMNFNGGNMSYYDYTSGSANIDIRTTFTSNVGKFQDYSAWYHAMFVYDSDQGTDTNRVKFYINGVRFPVASLVGTSGGSVVWPSSGFNSKINTSGNTHVISDNVNGTLDGYIAEIYFIDGQALEPTSFGEFNTSGVFVPIAYSGTFGDNGFFIDGRDSSDLGDDESGNGNDFSTSGLAANDQMSDSPTNNYCVLNALQQDATGLSNGNLQFTTSSTSTHKMASATIAQTSGKWYCEVTCNATLGSNARIGIIPEDNDNYTGSDGHVGDDANSFAYVDNGKKESNNSQSSYGASYANGDVIAMALNLDDNEITFYKDGSSQGTISITANTEYRFAASQYNAGGMAFNFGQAAFAATPPTGFKALNTDNLATPTITDPSKHFQTTLYTGNGSTQSINQSGNSTFQPDLVWIKNRDATDSHIWTDAVRGATKIISSDSTDAESTDADTLTAFESDGFALGDDDKVNTNTEKYVAWQWLANGSGSSNTDGSINTTATSVNATAGFSIIEWTGTGANGTIGHGLGVQPKFYVAKNTATTNSWMVGSTLFENTKFLILNATDAADTAAAVWNSAYPTSSVINLGSNVGSNGASGTGNMICYAFAEVEGFSSISTYTGNNNANGPYVYTGFTPRYILIKSTGTESWPILDTARGSSFGADAGTGGTNPTAANDLNAVLVANTNAAEEDNATGSRRISFYSNGFKVRTTNTAMNGSGTTYIYMAFAEHPFGGDGIAPATAR